MLQVRRILFPTDYSACAEAALTQAGRFADVLGAQLHVVHVHETPDAHEDDFAFEGVSRSALDAIGVVEVTLRWPSVQNAIVRYAKAQDIDLIVMGTHGRHGLNVLMGSVAEAVTRRAHCPVLTVRPNPNAHDPWMLRRILAPVDLSERSREGVRYAHAVAQLFNADVKVVHVIDQLPAPVGEVMDVPPIYPQAVIASARSVVESLVEEEMQGYPAEVEVVVGHAPTELLAQAEAYNADLILLTSHGRTGLRRFLLGSVAEKMMRHATCPVFTLKSFGKKLLAPLRTTKRSDSEASSRILEGCMVG